MGAFSLPIDPAIEEKIMVSPSLATRIFVSGILAVSAGLAHGQPFPYKPIRIITSLPGGATDFVARLVAAGISGPLGQQVIVDSRPSNITAELTMNAQPDGYTLLVEAGSMWFATLLQKTPYDVLRDFVPITTVIASPTVLVVHPGVPVNSVKELIALAKAKPGVLNYGSAGHASTPHLATELFKYMTGINVVHVPYKGAGPAVIDLVGGQIQMMIGTAPSVMPNVKSGKLRALAVSTAQPSALVPGLPTIAASGLPGYEFASLNGVFGVAKTPDAIIRRLHQEIVRALQQPDTREKLFNAGTEVLTMSPEEFTAKLKSEFSKWGKLIKEVGIKAD
jgi:tripartite-type tricarboxylate transporter receptor subunit TctC